MRVLVQVLLVYCFINLVIIGVGTGLGYFLKWLMDEIPLGTSILIGVVTTGIAVFIFAQILMFLTRLNIDSLRQQVFEDMDDDAWDDEDDDDWDDEDEEDEEEEEPRPSWSSRRNRGGRKGRRR